MFHKIKTFISLPGKRLLAEAWLTQLYVGLVLKFVPFKKIPVLFSNPDKRKEVSVKRKAESLKPGTQNMEQQLGDLRSAVMLSGKYTIWRNKCLVQSLAARRMLKRRDISSQLSLGLRRDEHNKTYAHAWLKVGDIEIVEKREDYLEMYVF